MRVLISTHFRDATLAVLDDQFPWYSFDEHTHFGEGNTEIVLVFQSDLHYPELNGWGADALASGYLFGFRVER